MSNLRVSLAVVITMFAACGAPSTAIAPSHGPAVEGAGLNIRSITTVAAALNEPLALSGIVASPLTLVRSDSGEQRMRQVLTGAGGDEILRIESSLDGSLRLVARSGVPLEGGEVTQSSAIARALRQLMRLGLEIPSGGPSVSTAAGRVIVAWTRQVRGVSVPDDGTRVVLNAAGALVGLSIEESPLAAPPAHIAQSDGALRAASLLLPSSTTITEGPTLSWTKPTDVNGEVTSERVPRRLAWCMRGTLHDGTAVEVQLDAGTLALLGWDSAP